MDFLEKVKRNYKSVLHKCKRMQKWHFYIYWKKPWLITMLFVSIYYKYSRGGFFRTINLWRLDDIVREINEIYKENIELKNKVERWEKIRKLI